MIPTGLVSITTIVSIPCPCTLAYHSNAKKIFAYTNIRCEELHTFATFQQIFTKLTPNTFNRLEPVYEQSWLLGPLLRRTRRFFLDNGRDHRPKYRYS